MRFTPKESGSGGKNFLKLQSGESKAGVLRGEVYEFKIRWEDGKSTVVPNDDPKLNNRFKVNFVVFEDNKFVAKVWEFGVSVYNNLADIASEYDLTKTKIRISRKGTGMETVYSILPLLKEPISDSVMGQITACPLQTLGASERSAPSSDGFAYGDPGPEADMPF